MEKMSTEIMVINKQISKETNTRLLNLPKPPLSMRTSGGLRTHSENSTV